MAWSSNLGPWGSNQQVTDGFGSSMSDAVEFGTRISAPFTAIQSRSQTGWRPQFSRGWDANTLKPIDTWKDWTNYETGFNIPTNFGTPKVVFVDHVTGLNIPDQFGTAVQYRREYVTGLNVPDRFGAAASRFIEYVAGFNDPIQFGTVAERETEHVTGFNVPTNFGAAASRFVEYATGFDIPDQFGTVYEYRVEHVSGFNDPLNFGTVAETRIEHVTGLNVPVNFGTPRESDAVAVVGFNEPIHFGAATLYRAIHAVGFDIPIQFGTPAEEGVVHVAGFDIPINFGNVTADQHLAALGFNLPTHLGIIAQEDLIHVAGFNVPLQFGAVTSYEADRLSPTYLSALFPQHTELSTLFPLKLDLFVYPVQIDDVDAKSIWGDPILNTPAEGDVLILRSGQWVMTKITLDDIGPAFGITSFSGGTATKEVGDTIASPVNFTAAYTAAPTSAQIQDDQGNPALALVTPFTSGSYAFAYTKTGNNNSVSWTLTAIGATTKTATNSAHWRPRIYYGTATPPGVYNQASLLSLAHALASQPLNASNSLTVNYNATAGQKCYFISPASYGTASATFGGFPFGATLVGTFTDTNGFGVSQTYNVVESNLASLGALNGVIWS